MEKKNTENRLEQYSDVFFQNYMQQYNDVITYLETKRKIFFNVCDNSELKQEIIKCFKSETFFNHEYITNCYLKKGAYFCCITYEEIGRHVCNSFPVMLGSNLDMQLLHESQKKSCSLIATRKKNNKIKITSKKCKCINNDIHTKLDFTEINNVESNNLYDLFFNMSDDMYKYTYGYFMIGGRFCWLPYLLTNNRELLHLISTKTVHQRSMINRKKMSYDTTVTTDVKPPEDAVPNAVNDLLENYKRNAKDKCFIRYTYDIAGKGHLFKYEKMSDSSVLFIHRNEKGIESINKVHDDIKTVISKKHINWSINVINNTLPDMINSIRNIDNLSNKLILSPATLLLRYVLKLQSNSNLVNIIYNGLWNKLISMTSENTNNLNKATFYNNRKKTIIREKNVKRSEKKMTISTHEMSNIYRKPLANQMGQRQLFSMVIRINSRKNNSVNIIPEEYTGFLCLLEKGTSIDSFNKQYSLLPDIVMPMQSINNKYLNINDILKKCVQDGKFKTYNNSTTLNYNQYYVLVNGGIPTKYIITMDDKFDDFFFYIKAMNPFIEIVFTGKIIVLNSIVGIIFKKIELTNGITIHLSPYELNEYFSHLIPYITVYGPQCKDIQLENLQYSKINKLLHGINYMKNRLQCSTFANLAIFAMDNVAFFLNKKKELKVTTSVSSMPEMVNMPTIFAVDPFCTQDGYLLHKDFVDLESFIFLRRYYIEIEYNISCKFIPNFEYGTPITIFNSEYSNGYINIGEIQNKLKNLSILKNQKVCSYTINHGFENYSHNLYIPLEYECLIRAKKLQCKCMAVMFKESTKLNSCILSIEVFLLHENETYDGLKISNPESQKGLASTSLDLHTRYPLYKPHLVTSAFTILGRMPIAQLKRMFYNMEKNKNDKNSDILYGDNKMCVLRNVTSDHKNVNLMRFDNLTINMLQLNNAHMTIYTLLQKTFNEKNKFLPMPNAQLLKLLLCLRKDIVFKSFTNEEYILSKM